nr:MAG TPA: Putative Holliday junction resolvase [Caudoviricetes sp.]
MKILAIDPSSNKIETSTTGIVLLDNARLVDSWVVSYGMRGFADWFHEIGESLELDVVVVEEYKARDNDKSKDNSVLETIAYIQLCYPNLILQNNAGYKSDIPDDLLKILGLWKFEKSHHQDIRAAARLGLFWAMRNDVEEVIQDVGKVVSEYHDNTKEVAS